jgi:hypothetical protein
MRYESVQPIGKAEALAVFETGTPPEIAGALIGLALHEDDWRWVQDTALSYLTHPDAGLRGTAALALGHLARLHGELDTARVLPALRELLTDATTAGRATDALDDIDIYLGRDGSGPG